MATERQKYMASGLGVAICATAYVGVASHFFSQNEAAPFLLTRNQVFIVLGFVSFFILLFAKPNYHGWRLANALRQCILWGVSAWLVVSCFRDTDKANVFFFAQERLVYLAGITAIVIAISYTQALNKWLWKVEALILDLRGPKLTLLPVFGCAVMCAVLMVSTKSYNDFILDLKQQPGTIVFVALLVLAWTILHKRSYWFAATLNGVQVSIIGVFAIPAINATEQGWAIATTNMFGESVLMTIVLTSATFLIGVAHFAFRHRGNSISRCIITGSVFANSLQHGYGCPMHSLLKKSSARQLLRDERMSYSPFGRFCCSACHTIQEPLKQPL